MTAPVVEKYLNVIDDILLGSRSAEILHSKTLLNFEAAEEALCDSIIPAIAFSAHTGQYSMVLEQFLEILAAILATPVRMKDKALRRFASPDCHGQCIHDQALGNAVVHRPSHDHDTTGIEIDHHRHVQPSLGGPDVGNVSNPGAIRVGHGKPTIQKLGATGN